MGYAVLFLAMVVPVAFAIACLLLFRAWRGLDKRRAPLTFELRNLPGEHARSEAARHNEEFTETAGLTLMLGPLMLSGWLIARLQSGGVDWTALRFGTGDAIFAVVTAGLLAWTVVRLIRSGRARRRYLDGLQAELAVAQCLTPLIADGAMVFHDFPTGKGNIDHIVVGRSAVFAIETKWRRKPAQTGRDAARVQFDGQQLLFPHHAETKPVEQARYQGEWLAKFLKSGLGESVPVLPMLALPGWYVESTNRTVRHDMLASNCHNAAFMMGDKFGPPLPEPLRRRIAHVLIQRYPALEFN